MLESVIGEERSGRESNGGNAKSLIRLGKKELDQAHSFADFLRFLFPIKGSRHELPRSTTVLRNSLSIIFKNLLAFPQGGATTWHTA
jgi:hypothetical protein